MQSKFTYIFVAIYFVTVMVESAEERGKRGQDGRNQAALFYAEYGMVASSDTRWIQGTFSTLVGLFDRVDLWNIFGKTVGVVFRPYQAVGPSRRRSTGNG